MELTIKEYINKFLGVLYNDDETACFAEDKYGTNCYPKSKFDPKYHQFITLNPCSGGRGNEFVTAYRNFLVEIDSEGMSLEDQYEFFKSIQMPYSAITFSGNKSLHYVISLDRPLLAIETYKQVGDKLARAIGHPGLDVGVIKRPATFTRAPMGVRKSNGRIQKICEVFDRVNRDDFNVWLSKRLPGELLDLIHKKKKKFVQKENYRTIGDPSIFRIRRTELNWLIEGDFPKGERSDRWYRVACQASDAGYSYDEAIVTLEKYFYEDSDFLYREWEGIIRGVFDKHAQ